MALTDLFVRNVKHSGATAGDKYSDEQGMFLLVKQTHKYWRLSYRFLGKQKALALGVYPAVSLALARKRRQEARDLLVHGTDPSEARRDAKLAAIVAASNTFGVLARQWLEQIESSRTMKTPLHTGAAGFFVRVS